MFDFLTFSYDKGTVTLMGYPYHWVLKHDAVRVVKRANGKVTLLGVVDTEG